MQKKLEIFTRRLQITRGYANNPSQNDERLGGAGSRNKFCMVITNDLKQHFISLLPSSFSQ